MPRAVIRPIVVSRKGRYPRVGPYCSTLPSVPVSNSRQMSVKSIHGNWSSAGYPGAKETMSFDCDSTLPICRIADSFIRLAA